MKPKNDSTNGLSSQTNAPQRKANPDRKIQILNDIGKKLGRMKTEDISLTNNPFHNQIRASTYGDIYDEIEWRVKVEFENRKPRDGVDRFALTRAYHPTGVRINNWVEESRDKNFIKYGRLPRISTFGYFYETTSNAAYSKTLCDTERSHLQNIHEPFSKGAFPGHQPELDTDVVWRCNPVSESCIALKEKEIKIKERTQQDRYEKAAASDLKKPLEDSVFNRADLGKCMNR